MEENIAYYSKDLKMQGTFLGAGIPHDPKLTQEKGMPVSKWGVTGGPQILAYGHYTKSPTSIRAKANEHEKAVKEVEQVQEITVFSQTDDLPLDESML